jgi:hypothetical protein
MPVPRRQREFQVTYTQSLTLADPTSRGYAWIRLWENAVPILEQLFARHPERQSRGPGKITFKLP